MASIVTSTSNTRISSNTVFMSQPLVGPKLKVERANNQIREVEAAIIAFQREQRYELFSEKHSEEGYECLKLRATNELPAEISVITGEALFNLRSALDQAVHSAASRNGVLVMERSGFPIEVTEQKFESKLRKRKIQDRLPDLADFLRELKPYKRGNSLLWQLHILNSTDKHKILVPIGGAHLGSNFQLSGRPIGIGRHTFRTPKGIQPLDKEPVLVIYPAGMQLVGDIQIITDVAFRDIEGAQVKMVLPTLQQFSDMTSGIIGSMEKRFFV